MNLLLTGGQIGGIVAGAVGLLIIIIVIWAICTRNKFVQMENQYEEAFYNIDVYLKKRYDLIPNLVETVKGYAAHEKETFLKVTEARTKVASAVTPEEKAIADGAMTQAMRNFNLVMEQYPELKANANFLDLQAQLKSIENELSQARKYYNACARELNTKRSSFPAFIVANRMKLEKQPFFTVDSPEERQNVKVQF